VFRIKGVKQSPPKAELSRSRRRLCSDAAQEQGIAQRIRKQKGWRLSALA
jgi:hypothetical protein